MQRTARSVVASALLGVVFLTGCAVAPTTTVSRPDGTDVTVNWEDYPASAGMNAEEILAAPREKEVEAIGTALFAALRESLDEQFELRWTESGEAGWYPEHGNGYGGESVLITYNSSSSETDSAPSSPSDWRSIVERVSTVTEANGLGTVVLDHEMPPSEADEVAWQRDLHNRFGTDDPDRYWIWTGTAYRNAQWLAVSIVDVERDPTGKATDDLGDEPGQYIAFSYGATVIPDSERDAFVRALEPFRELERPPASHSD